MRINCWEYKQCGWEAGGPQAVAAGTPCPASMALNLDSLNRGHNGGRLCWAVTRTQCNGRVQGTFTEKFLDCRRCDFFKLVSEEEGRERFILYPRAPAPPHDVDMEPCTTCKGRVITLVHFRSGRVQDAKVLAMAATSFIKRYRDVPIAVLHDATLLQMAAHDYRDVFVHLEKELTAHNVLVAAVFPNALMRVLARTINNMSGQTWHFFRSLDEAHRFLSDAGYATEQVACNVELGGEPAATHLHVR